MNQSSVTSPSRQPTRADDAGTGWSVDALREVWARQQEQVSGRIGVVEHALAALADDQLAGGLRGEAERAAHTLAGSLGMFGFMSAADAARKLEQKLANPEPACKGELSTLLKQLQAGVKGPVVLCSDIEDSIPDGLDAALSGCRGTSSHVRRARTPETIRSV
jgi:HPt (histidine-containing phosphotransfer) domain-containing protein